MCYCIPGSNIQITTTNNARKFKQDGKPASDPNSLPRSSGGLQLITNQVFEQLEMQGTLLDNHFQSFCDVKGGNKMKWLCSHGKFLRQ